MRRVRPWILISFIGSAVAGVLWWFCQSLAYTITWAIAGKLGLTESSLVASILANLFPVVVLIALIFIAYFLLTARARVQVLEEFGIGEGDARGKVDHQPSLKGFSSAGTIDSHKRGDAVDESLARVFGKLTKPLPEHFELWLIRRWENRPESFYPVKRVVLTENKQAGTYEWEAHNVSIGGDPGNGDGRFVELWLVGPDGRCLLTTWTELKEKYSDLINDTKTQWTRQWLVPPIQQPTKDMICCASVLLRRK